MDSFRKSSARLVLWMFLMTNLLTPVGAVNASTSIVSTSETFEFVMPDWDVSLFAESEANTYTVVFDGNGNTNDVAMDNFIMSYDSADNLPKNLYVRDGYDFLWWSESGSATMQDYRDQAYVVNLTFSWSITLYAVWEARTDTEYTVEHYQQNADNDEYTLVGSQTLQGETDTLTNAQANSYSGFKVLSFSQQTIKWDESTVIEIKYDRENYSVIFETSGWTVIDPIEAKYGQTIIDLKPSDPEKTWYTFNGWNPSYPETMPLDGTGLTALWTANTNTAYKVLHKQKQLNWEYVTVDTDNLQGTTAEQTNAVANTYTWFTAQSFEQETIAADGSTEITIYYTRNEHTVTYLSKWEVYKTDTIKYWATLERPTLSKSWYDFKWWSGVVIMPDEDTTLVALWDARSDTAYTVKHYLQNIENDEYTLDDTENLQWTTEQDTNAVAKTTYDWFTVQPFEQVEILWTWGSVVEIYYNRNIHTISFNSAWGSSVTSITAKYGTSITEPSQPTRNWYGFSTWSPSFPSTMPDEDMELTAVWTKNGDTAYTVQHYFEDLNGNYPNESELTSEYIDEKTWETESTTDARARTEAGFTAQSFSQKEISGEWDTVVKIYYKRNSYTVSYDGNWWTTPDSKTLKYWVTIPRDVETIRVWYDFVEWQWATTVPANDVTLVAQWTASTNIAYKVRHLLENADDDNYSLDEEESLIWTTNELATFDERTYSWFKAGVYESQIISWDWSTVIEVKYDRYNYTVEFDVDGGSNVSPITAKYGAHLIRPANPEKTWYNFNWWIPSFPSTMPLNGTGLIAQWSPSTNTRYTVNHYIQNITWDAYDLSGSESYRGTTLWETEAEAHNYTWFEAQDFNQETISADGSTVVNIYYTRNSYQIIPVAGTWIASIEGAGYYKYESIVHLLVETMVWYAFPDWTTEKIVDVVVDQPYPKRVTVWATPNRYTVVYTGWFEDVEGVMSGQTFIYDKTWSLSTNSLSRSGYLFSWWIDEYGMSYEDGQDVINMIPEGEILLTAEWKASTKIYLKDGDKVLAVLELAIWEDLVLPENPTKDGYIFEGWDWLPEDGKVPAEGLELTAIWSAVDSTPRAWGGWGRRINTSDEEHGSAEGTGDIKNTISTGNDVSWTTTWDKKMSAIELLDPAWLTKAYGNEEIIDAYQWAYNHDITTLAPLDNAMPDGYVLRGHMAKMVVNYALNVLWWELPTELPKECKWRDSDSTWESDEIKDYAIKSCALGLMGIDMNYFYPNMKVSRAQFGTILSRLLYGKKYAGWDPYYKNHLNALKKNGIMTQIGNPESRLELRQRVWVMLLRASMK